MKPVIIGTRGSPLALAQAEIICRWLAGAQPGLTIQRRIIKTTGDRFLDVSLAAAGGKGLFTKEIEDQLLAGQIDLAVHSLKDLPTQLPAALILGAVPPRADPRDVLVSERYRTLDELPHGARVGTSSIRRKAQLLACRPDLQVIEIRGNIGTRLQKAKELDAVILAAAGLQRLGWPATGTPLPVEVMLPAVGQGIIACEIREADQPLRELLERITDPATRACAIAEREFLRAMGGGCQLPYAALAEVTGGLLRLQAARFEPRPQRATVTGPADAAAELGREAARQLA